MTTILAWMPRYRPFIMGGDVHQGIKMELDIVDTLEIGRGYRAHVVKAPNGASFYIEADCGAVLGNDLMMILSDVKEGGEDVMRQQIDAGKVQRDRAEKTTNAPEFWSYIKGSGATRRAI